MGYFVDNTQSDTEGLLGSDPDRYVNLAKRLAGQTDQVIFGKARREQKLLRGALGIGKGNPRALAACAICGARLPEQLLVAAHIKPRRECSEEERKDLPHIAMPACLLGCDALYERGLISVAEGGIIDITQRPGAGSEELLRVLHRLKGKRTAAWSERRAEYFAWHRRHRFQS